jgi:ribose transport system permease protein
MVAENGNEGIVLKDKNGSIGISRRRFTSFLLQYNSLIILIVLIALASITSPVFSSHGNIFTLARQQTTYMLISLGMLFVIVTGNIDLSVSSIAAMGSIMTAVALSQWGLEKSVGGMIGAMAIGVVVCTLIGMLNGFLVAYLKMPSFIVTLATSIGFQGVAYMITKGSTMMLDVDIPGNHALLNIGESVDPWFGIPYLVYFVAAIVVLFGFIWVFTSFGRLVIATGSNETAVRMAGINTKGYQLSVFTICGALTGIAGVILTARTGTATALTTSVDYNLTTIAAVVIGGCSLSGGEGSVAFTVVGVFVIAVIGNIMNLVNLAVYTQMVVKAVIIILAVLLKSMNSKTR